MGMEGMDYAVTNKQSIHTILRCMPEKSGTFFKSKSLHPNKTEKNDFQTEFSKTIWLIPWPKQKITFG